MACAAEVQTDGGRAVVLRTATGPDVAALRCVGERLRSAAHPGVVEVLRSEGTDDRWELHLVHGGRPVDVGGPLGVAEVAGMAAAVAATLADLHAAGIVHGRIAGGHVLVGAHGRPLLCGFGSAPPPEAGPDDDVAALGALIISLLGDEPDVDPIPHRRWRHATRGDAWPRRALLLVADHACAEPASRRPTARRLAAAIADAVPDAVMPGSSPAPRRSIAAAWALVGALVLGGGVLRLASAPDPSLEPPVVPMAAASSTTVAPSTSILPTVPCTAVAVPPPGCGEEITVEGTTAIVGARRYEVGSPGDRVVVGDWDGDLILTAAVLRPATGEVFVFPTWTLDGDVTVPPSVRVEGAIALLVVRVRDHDALRIRRRDGSEVPLVGAEEA